GVRQRRGIHGNLLSARVKNFLRIPHRSDPARDTEGNVEHPRDAVDPFAINRPTLRARRDVIENELVSALIAIARRQLHNVAHDLEVAEADALYNLAVADIEAGDDASCKNGRNSSEVIRSSSNALPLTAPATPVLASVARSDASRTPPDACQS